LVPRPLLVLIVTFITVVLFRYQQLIGRKKNGKKGEIIGRVV